MRHSWRTALGLASVLCLVGARLAPGAAAQSPRRPNVLLIIADDQNNDLGTYGAPVSTPNIDRLAQRGVRFDHAYDQYPLCSPSRSSFLTGLRPDSVGIYDLTTHFRTRHPKIVTLPQLFKNDGYFTARVGKIYHYNVPMAIGTNGLDDAVSWNAVYNPRGNDRENMETIVGVGPHGSSSYRVDDVPDELETDGMVASQAVDLLRQNRNRPFFLAVGFFRPHFPYVAPKKYFDLYPVEQIPAPADPTADVADVPAAALMSTRPLNQGMNNAEMRLAIRGYRAGTSFMDSQVGRVLAELDRLGLRESTIVVFLGDHGYSLGQKGLWMKQNVYEQGARAPLIISAPGRRSGVATPAIVEFVDIYPTIADLAGLTAPAYLQGRSLKPLLADPQTSWPYAAFTQIQRAGGGPSFVEPEDARAARAMHAPAVPDTGGAPRFSHPWAARAMAEKEGLPDPRYAKKREGTPPRETFMGRSVRTDRWRYTEWDGGRRGVELYDELNDPGETKNLASDPRYASTAAELKKLLATDGRPMDLTESMRH
ncbi:MAG TPA: sulfatase [Longimicrobiaceae bacterium]|nr:sulfatase [Longimicrobiaceae bacterium]